MIHCYEFYASPVISKPRYFELFSISLGTSKQRGSTVYKSENQYSIMFPFFSFLFFFFPLLNSILLHVFVFQRIIYILIKDGSPSLSQAKKLKYFLRNEAICLLICCLFFVQYSLSSIAFREATVIVCNYARYVLLKKKPMG